MAAAVEEYGHGGEEHRGSCEHQQPIRSPQGHPGDGQPQHSPQQRANNGQNPHANPIFALCHPRSTVYKIPQLFHNNSFFLPSPYPRKVKGTTVES
nr:MAG TPA: hypothetical protein [Caudoviricetes sp.]